MTGANHYYLYVADETAGGTAVINDPDITGTSFTPSTGLTPGHSYVWYIFAVSTNEMDDSYLMSGLSFQIT